MKSMNTSLTSKETISGYLEVGLNEIGEIVINHPDLKPDKNGVGHIVFSANQARHLARVLLEKSTEADRMGRFVVDDEGYLLLTLKDAAKLYGGTYVNLHAMIRRGRLKEVRIGVNLYIRKADVLALKNQKVKS